MFILIIFYAILFVDIHNLKYILKITDYIYTQNTLAKYICVCIIRLKINII